MVRTGAKASFSLDGLGLVIWHIEPQALEAFRVALSPGVWPDRYDVGGVEGAGSCEHSGHWRGYVLLWGSQAGEDHSWSFTE